MTRPSAADDDIFAELRDEAARCSEKRTIFMRSSWEAPKGQRELFVQLAGHYAQVAATIRALLARIDGAPP